MIKCTIFFFFIFLYVGFIGFVIGLNVDSLFDLNPIKTIADIFTVIGGATGSLSLIAAWYFYSSWEENKNKDNHHELSKSISRKLRLAKILTSDTLHANLYPQSFDLKTEITDLRNCSRGIQSDLDEFKLYKLSNNEQELTIEQAIKVCIAIQNLPYDKPIIKIQDDIEYLQFTETKKKDNVVSIRNMPSEFNSVNDRDYDLSTLDEKIGSLLDEAIKKINDHDISNLAKK